MEAKILSLNIGHPAPMEWNGKSIVSSMLKHPVPGPLVVSETAIEGNSFANPNFHGTNDSVLYAYGMASALAFISQIGRSVYEPGSAGENVTLDELNEDEVSIGDIFAFGEVMAQATWPRIPCGKVNFRFQHERGQKAMQECRKPGVYFRILKPGKIHATDSVKRTERAKITFSITEAYGLAVRGEKPSAEQFARVEANGAFPSGWVERWKKM